MLAESDKSACIKEPNTPTLILVDRLIPSPTIARHALAVV